MIGIAHQARIFIYAVSTDTRKRLDRLSGIVKIDFRKDVLGGDHFVFFNRSLDRYKILVWDHDGLVLVYKRLEQSCFQRLPSNGQSVVSEVYVTTLTLTPSGINLLSAKRRKRFSPDSPAKMAGLSNLLSLCTFLSQSTEWKTLF